MSGCCGGGLIEGGGGCLFLCGQTLRGKRGREGEREDEGKDGQGMWRCGE